MSNKTNETSDRERGVVASFLPKKGFGFVTGPDGEKLFIHFSDIKGKGFRGLEPGEPVEYRRAVGEKGPVAVDVVRLNPPAHAPLPDDPIRTKKTW